MRTRVIIRSAVFAAAIAGFAGGAFAQGAEAADSLAPEGAGVAVAPISPVAPWYQEYTQDGARFDLSGFPLDRGETTVDIAAGSDWGVSLGFESSASPSSRNENVDGLSAGAYFKLTPRMRVGGELGYRSLTADPSRLRPNAETGSSQIKLESAFRF